MTSTPGAEPWGDPPTQATKKRNLTAPIYERQDDEGDEAWGAFRTYRDQGLSRTLEAVRGKLGKEPGYLRLLERWSSEWGWVRRCIEYDRHLDRKRREAAEQEVVRMAERQARDAALMQDGLRPFIEALAAKANVTMTELLQMNSTEVAALVKELAPAWKAAQQQERLARGASTENVRVEGSLVVSDLRAAFLESLKEEEAVSGSAAAEAKLSRHGMDSGDEAAAEPESA